MPPRRSARISKRKQNGASAPVQEEQQPAAPAAPVFDLAAIFRWPPVAVAPPIAPPIVAPPAPSLAARLELDAAMHALTASIAAMREAEERLRRAVAAIPSSTAPLFTRRQPQQRERMPGKRIRR